MLVFHLYYNHIIIIIHYIIIQFLELIFNILNKIHQIIIKLALLLVYHFNITFDVKIML